MTPVPPLGLMMGKLMRIWPLAGEVHDVAQVSLRHAGIPGLGFSAAVLFTVRIAVLFLAGYSFTKMVV